MNVGVVVFKKWHRRERHYETEFSGEGFYWGESEWERGEGRRETSLIDESIPHQL